MNAFNKKNKKKSTKKKYTKKTNQGTLKRPVKLSIFAAMIALCMLFVVNEVAKNVQQMELANYSTASKTDFISSLEKIAIKEYRRGKVLPSITISQAILESNWGKSKLTTEGKNLFGIKANGNWNGPYLEYKTNENYDDVITAKFRKYNTVAQSVEDHTDFLIENGRYKKAGLFDTNNYKEQAEALERAGYATKKDSNGEHIYADLLISVIEKYELYKIDEKVVRSIN